MTLTVSEAREILLSYPSANDKPHMDRKAYRAGGRIFATLRDGDGQLNVMLPLDYQEMMCDSDPGVFSPVPGGWGPLGWTRVDISAAGANHLRSALDIAVKASLENRRQKRR
jgi:hypothetical protein